MNLALNRSLKTHFFPLNGVKTSHLGRGWGLPEGNDDRPTQWCQSHRATTLRSKVTPDPLDRGGFEPGG